MVLSLFYQIWKVQYPPPIPPSICKFHGEVIFFMVTSGSEFYFYFQLSQCRDCLDIPVLKNFLAIFTSQTPASYCVSQLSTVPSGWPQELQICLTLLCRLIPFSPPLLPNSSESTVHFLIHQGALLNKKDLFSFSWIILLRRELKFCVKYFPLWMFRWIMGCMDGWMARQTLFSTSSLD